MLANEVEAVLLENILSEYAEDRPETKQLIRSVCREITDAQAQVFLGIYNEVKPEAPPRSIRTRRVSQTSTDPVGLRCCDSTIVKGKSREVFYVGLPTKKEKGAVEFYLTGIAEDPSHRSAPLPDGSKRLGERVRRAIVSVDSVDAHELISWGCQMWRQGFQRAHSK